MSASDPALRPVGLAPRAQPLDREAVYHDDVIDYSTNEPTMDGTASACCSRR